MTLTPEQSKLLRRLATELEQISKWPWQWYNGNSWWRLGVADDQARHSDVICPMVARDGHPDLNCGEADRVFIAHAPEAIAALLSLCAELGGERDKYFHYHAVERSTLKATCYWCGLTDAQWAEEWKKREMGDQHG